MSDSLFRAGQNLLKLGRYDEAEETLKHALQGLPPTHADYAEVLKFIGVTHIERSTYAEAIPYLRQSVALYAQCCGEQNAPFTIALEKLAQAYLYNGQYKEAIGSLEKVLATQQQIFPANHPDIARTYMSMGAFQKYIKKYDDALFYFNQALRIRLAEKEKSSMAIADCYSQIGQVHLYQKEFKTALRYFLQEDSLMVSCGENARANYLYTCSDLGKAYLAMGRFPEALHWQTKAVGIAKAWSKKENTNLATLFLYLGRAQSAMRQYPEAIESFRANERILRQLYGSECTILYHNYAEMGHAYAQWYAASQADTLLEKSRQCFEQAVAVIQKAVREEPLAEARQKVLAEAVPYFERAIGTELVFYQKTQDPASLEKAWQLSETMHSYLLFSAAQEANARHFAGIPDEALQRDSLLQRQIAALGVKRTVMLQKQGLILTDSLVMALNIQMTEKKQAQQHLRATFEKDYPNYFRLKYELHSASLEKTRQMLHPEQTLLEYFVGDSTIFLFVVQQSGSRVIRLKHDFPLLAWVQSMGSSITDYHTVVQKTPARYEKNLRQYAEVAPQLYQKLIAPIASTLTPELIVVPGDGMAGLPFEALLSAAPSDVSNFNTYPFLVRRHTVHYAYSATMLHQMTNRKHLRKPKGKLLAFAPFFTADTAQLALHLQKTGGNRQGLLPLPYSGEEVLRAKNRFGDNYAVFFGENASKQRFFDLAADYQILHLATHGKANPLAGESSFLAFYAADEGSGNGLLSVGELYNLSLNAQLVLLSACETGLGEQQRGEGVVSLARAFAFAGAKSVVASLWRVNDQSTMQLMDFFYANLQSGKAKNHALSQAKRQYLEKNPGRAAHPFYWAGFVGIGALD